MNMPRSIANASLLAAKLKINDDPATEFDSGLVPGGGSGEFPDVSISISMPDSGCFNIVMRVDAAAVRLKRHREAPSD